MKKQPFQRWIEDLRSALGIYIPGDTAPTGGITAGKFYFWNGKIRYPTANIAANVTLTDQNMPEAPEGGLNKVNDQRVKKSSSYTYTFNVGSHPSFNEYNVGNVYSIFGIPLDSNVLGVFISNTSSKVNTTFIHYVTSNTLYFRINQAFTAESGAIITFYAIYE